jgi:hypothetical protein
MEPKVIVSYAGYLFGACFLVAWFAFGRGVDVSFILAMCGLAVGFGAEFLWR